MRYVKDAFLFLNRFVCWGDPCVWRICSSWLCHWTHVHHWWRGWGESERYRIVGKTTDCLVMQGDIYFAWVKLLIWRNISMFAQCCEILSSLVWFEIICSFVFKVHNYKRLTPFSISNQAVESLDNLKPGDCIVCFSKNDIYSISRQIEIRGLECAVIYGSLPPGKFHMVNLWSGFIFLNCLY